jgi:hypothetical protein
MQSLLFECDQCLLKFAGRIALRVHFTKVHKPEKMEKYLYDVEKKMCKTHPFLLDEIPDDARAWRKHRKYFHDVKGWTPEVSPQYCCVSKLLF